MSYAAEVPQYVVTLPCNHKFRSTTRVVTNMQDVDSFEVDELEDAEDIAWLYCQHCEQNYALEGWELEEYQSEPRDAMRTEKFPNGRILGEKRLARMYDEAVIKDRIRRALLKSQGRTPQSQIAEDLGASLRTVESVAADLRALSRYPSTEEKEEVAVAA